METADLHQLFLKSKGISTDTRENLKNKLFFALKGENFDGNRFAQQALSQGAKWAFVDDRFLPANPRYVVVDDVLKTLQQLANFHRRYLGLSIIAITGSNGKTTTKELITRVLSTRYVTAHTAGNLNNHIGVPLTLLKMNVSTEIGVVEMGANHQKEIAVLCEIAAPDYGYITNFGKAHLEGFGGFEGVIKGKSELYDYLIAHDGTIFVNADDTLQMQQSSGGNRIIFSQNKKSDCQIPFIEADPYVEVEFQGKVIKSQLLGGYNAKNISAAIGIGNYFHVSSEAIKRAIESYKPHNNRSQILKRASNQIILDAYNANPTSMQLALDNLESYKAERRIAILGDMFEIGETALEEHQKIVDFLEDSSLIDQGFVCGTYFSQTRTESIHKFKNFETLKNRVASQNFTNSTILVKGSRSMAMERVLEII